MVRRRRVWQAGPWLVAAALLLPAASVFACGVKATLQLAVAEAAPGDHVAGTGAAFSNSHGGGPTAEPVVLRFGSSTGPVLWSGRPDADGTISFTFAVPAAAPGAYVILAIQNNADGEPAPGTPARADFVVLAPPPPATTATTSTTSQPASTTTHPPAVAVTPPADIQSNAVAPPGPPAATAPTPTASAAGSSTPAPANAATPTLATRAAPVVGTAAVAPALPELDPALPSGPLSARPAPLPSHESVALATSSAAATEGGGPRWPFVALMVLGVSVVVGAGVRRTARRGC